MADEFEINGKITGDASDFEKAVDKARNATDNLSSGMDKTSDSINGGLKSWGINLDTFYNKGSGIFKNFGIDIDQFASHFGMSGKLMSGIVAVTVALEKLGEEIQKMSANIAKGTGAIGEELDKLKESANDALVNGVGRSAEEVGTMIADLNTRFGLTGDALTEMTTKFHKFAKVTDTEVKGAIKGVADIVYKWGINVEDTGALMDQLTVASQKSGASIEDLMSSLKSSQSIFQQYGMSLTESIAFEANLAKKGIDASNVLMGMRSALKKFSDEGKNGAQGLKEISDKIQKATSDAEALNIAIDTFGTRSGPEMLRMLRENSDELQNLQESLENAGGAVEQTEQASRTVSDAWADLKATLQGTFGGFGEGIANLFRSLIDKVRNFVQSISPIIRPIGEIFNEVFTFVGDLIVQLSSYFIQFQEKYNKVFTSVAEILGKVKDFIVSALKDVLRVFQDCFGLIFAILEGDWARAWEYLKNIFLHVIKIITDALSALVNLFGKILNEIIKPINTVQEKLRELARWLNPNANTSLIRSIPLIEEVDFSNWWGIAEAVKESDEALDALAEKATTKLVGNLGSYTSSYSGTSPLGVTNEFKKEDENNLKEREKYFNEWSKKRYMTEVEELEREYQLELDRLDEEKAGVDERIALHKKYFELKLEAYMRQVEAERELELQRAQEYEQSEEIIANINKYYDDKIADYKIKSMRNVNKVIAEENSKRQNKWLEGLKKFFKGLAKVVSAGIKLFKKLMDLDPDEFLTSVLEIEDKILTTFSETIPKLPEMFGSIIESIINLLGSISSDPNFAKNIVDVVVKIGKILLDNLPTLITATMKLVVELVSELIARLPEIVGMIIKALPSIIKTLVTSIWDMIVGAFKSIGSWFSKGWDWLGDTLGWWATGVNNAPSGLAVVGEQGPELVDFKGGERVYNNQDTRQILSQAGSSGGNNFNVTFNNVQDTSAYTMMRQLKDYNRQMAINGVL